jgi:flap endonuclease-1
MLVGTDFNEGVKGIGPKKALKLVREFGSIDSMPAEVQDAVGPSVQEIREIFLRPDVTDDYEVRFGAPDIGGIVRFLCDEREFSRERVIAALDRTFGQPRLGTADDGF